MISHRGAGTQIILYDLNLVKSYLAQYTRFEKIDTFFSYKMFKNGLVWTEGKKWDRQRKFLVNNNTIFEKMLNDNIFK